MEVALLMLVNILDTLQTALLTVLCRTVLHFKTWSYMQRSTVVIACVDCVPVLIQTDENALPGRYVCFIGVGVCRCSTFLPV